MALQSQGSISLNDIATEFGGSTPHSLSEYYGAADGIPSSGSISFSQFYGKSAITYHTISNGGVGAFNAAPSGNYITGGLSFSTPGDSPQSFSYSISPGIPVSSSVKIWGSVGGEGKIVYFTMNSGLSNQVSSYGQNTVVSFSGLWTNFVVTCDTDDEDGDSYTFGILNIDGANNYTVVNNTTLSIP